MEENNRIVSATNKYDGSIESKKSLSFLFLVAYKNISCFVNEAKDYRKYLCNILNKKLDELSGNTDKLTEYYNNEIRPQEFNNVVRLHVELFNSLSSFYAFKQYITYADLKKDEKQKYKKQREELSEFNSILNKTLQAKIIDIKSSISINEFLKDCRNALIHQGKIICSFDLLPTEDGTKSYPSLKMEFNSIWNDAEINKRNLSAGYYIDAIDTFENILKCFEQLQTILDSIVKID